MPVDRHRQACSRPLEVVLEPDDPLQQWKALIELRRACVGAPELIQQATAIEAGGQAAVDDVEKVVRRMLKELETDAPKRDREVLIARAREKAKERYARTG